MGNNWDKQTSTVLKMLGALALAVIMAGCEIPRDTLNVGVQGAIIEGARLTVTVPTDMFGFEVANWVATWTASTSPYTIEWDFGGGAENIPSSVGVSGAVIPVTMNDTRDVATYIYTVTVKDGEGLVSTPATGTYTVGASRVPVPTMTTFVDGGTVTCTVANAYGDDVTISVTPGSGFGDPAPIVVAGGTGDAAFHFSSSDIFGGSSGTVTFTADDGFGGTYTATAYLRFDPMPLAVDTIYAIPMATSVAVDEAVTILVATGATGSFQFMLGVGLTIPADGTYVEETFNVGALGGDFNDADGVWANITSSFILGPDDLIMPGANPEDTLGTGNRFDFNISPLGGSDVASAEGELFSAQFSFSSAGDKAIGFQAFNGVNRTYYSDLASGTPTPWGSSVGATITVN